jgi:hypothetical protein
MTALQAEAFVSPQPTDPSELVAELTGLALASACKAEFRGRALALLSRALPFDRAVWEEIPPFGDVRVVYPGVSWIGGRDGESVGRRAWSRGRVRKSMRTPRRSPVESAARERSGRARCFVWISSVSGGRGRSSRWSGEGVRSEPGTSTGSGRFFRR